MAEIEVVYDKKEQYDHILEYVFQGETLYAVFDCKGKEVAFVGITDQRVIFYEQGYLLPQRTMVTIPYNQVIGIAPNDEGSFLQSSELFLLTTAGNVSFQFKQTGRTHWTYRFILNQILNQPQPQMRV